MMTKSYINYYLDAMKCYKTKYSGWIEYYGINANIGGYSFSNACWFTSIFLLFLILPVLLDILLIPIYIITFIVGKIITKGDE